MLTTYENLHQLAKSLTLPASQCLRTNTHVSPKSRSSGWDSCIGPWGSGRLSLLKDKNTYNTCVDMIYIYIHKCLYLYIHTYMHIRMYTYIYISLYIHIRLWVQLFGLALQPLTKQESPLYKHHCRTLNPEKIPNTPGSKPGRPANPNSETRI